MMKSNFSPIAIALVVLMFACNSDADGQTELSTYVSGSFKIGEDYHSENLSDYQVFIVDRSIEPVDTLYRAVADKYGYFNGEARFIAKGEYPIVIQKGSRIVDSFSLVLADSDTVTISAKLPDIRRTKMVDSFENRALRTLRRLETQYYRVINLINAGAVEENEIEDILNTWADLFWSVREDYAHTVASDRATHKSLEILEGWNPEKTLKRLNSDPSDNSLQDAAIYYGTLATITLQGLDKAIDYLNELDERSEKAENKRLISMNQVELLYDSLRVDQAWEIFEMVESRFYNTPDSLWATVMRYELTKMAPGNPLPDFTLQTNNQGNISLSTLQGSPFLLEIVELTNRQYQAIHPSLLQLIYSFSDIGIKLITVPLEHSAITVNAFYDERPMPWAVATSRAYESADLIEQFNIIQLPTRILVDAEGNIVRKYTGTNLQQLENDIQTLIK